MKLSEMKIDAAVFEDGGWVDNIPDMGDLRLKVRGINNADWRRMQAKLIEAVPRSKKVGGRIDPDEMDRVSNICLRETILLDWQGLEDESGSPLAYSKDVAGKLLTDPTMRRFRDAVAWAANVVAEQESATKDAVVGN